MRRNISVTPRQAINKHTVYLVRLVCVVVLLLLTGCSGGFMQTIQISSMAQKKQHHEIIRTLQPQLDQQESIPSFHLLLLSGAYYEIRDYKKCLATTQLLQKQIDKGDATYIGSSIRPYPLIMKGYVHLDQGNYSQAVKEARDAYRLIDTPEGRSNTFYHAQLIQITEISGVAEALLGNRIAAEHWLRILQGIPINGIIGPEKLTAIAKINMALGNHKDALTALRSPQAKVSGLITTFYDQTFQELPRAFIETKALFETGAIQQAKQGYDQLLRHPQITEIGSMYWPILLDRAKIARQEQETALAERLLKEAVEVVELQRATIASEAARIGFVGDKQAIYQELVNLLIATDRANQAFEYVERSKSRALVDLLASTHGIADPLINKAQTDSTLHKLANIEQSLGVVAENKTSNLPAPTTRGLVIALKKELAAEAPELASLVSVTSQHLKDIQNKLKEHETLLEFYGAGQTWYAFIVKHNGIWAKKLSLENLDETVQSFREQLSNPGSVGYQQQSRILYDQLINPISGFLTEQIVIVPHGVLHYLPFAALQGANGYLVDRHIVRILPAAGVLKYLKAGTTPHSTRTTLILGNPDRGDKRFNLQHAQEEAQAIAALMPDATVLLGNKATVSAVTKSNGKYRRFHIAAHGIFDSEEPLNSALLLAKESSDDGLLRASDLYRLNLNADLVTLSACETALSKVAKGDDLLGFTRGFLYAGTRSIVASLWKVDDLATKELMVTFYQNLDRMDKATALAKAQRSSKIKYPHPFYWAAFQLTGTAE